MREAECILAPIRPPVRRTTAQSIGEIEKAARKVGLSYGAYVAQLNAVSVIQAPAGKRQRKGRPS